MDKWSLKSSFVPSSDKLSTQGKYGRKKFKHSIRFDVEREVDIPGHLVGWVIGKEGCNVKRIQKALGVHMEILQDSKLGSPYCSKPLKIRGHSDEDVERAISEVEALMTEKELEIEREEQAALAAAQGAPPSGHKGPQGRVLGASRQERTKKGAIHRQMKEMKLQ